MYCTANDWGNHFRKAGILSSTNGTIPSIRELFCFLNDFIQDRILKEPESKADRTRDGGLDHLQDVPTQYFSPFQLSNRNRWVGILFLGLQ